MLVHKKVDLHIIGGPTNSCPDVENVETVIVNIDDLSCLKRGQKQQERKEI